MKKRFIILVIVSIAISLLGLVGIQLYWIRSAVMVKEMSFDRGVSEAVNSAINKFNKIELAQKMLLQRERGQQMNTHFQMLDSLYRHYYQQIMIQQAPGLSLNDTSAYSFRQETQLNIGLHTNENQQIYFDTSFFETHSSTRGINHGYLPGPEQRLQEDPFALFFERSKIINDLFDDMFSNRYSFHMSAEEGSATLDSLLNNELLAHGINTTYEFGIYNPVYNSLLKERTGKHTQSLLQSQYAFSLFPNDIFLNPEYLLVYFPEQKSYIFSQMNAMMATSALLILIIISSFGFTIITVIRQKRLSLMKNDFINNMTHELKTPISTISLACQALSDQDIQKSEHLYQSYINMIDEENKRLGLMTEKVLQTALIEKGKMHLTRSGFDMHEVISNAIQKIGLHVEARNGHITTSLDAKYSFIKADKVHLSNVLFNLLDNANKYSPTHPSVHVATENTSHGIIIHVSDNGIGISRVNQKKIFDNLYRVSTGNIHDVKGFGLGLSYVKAISEKHGGWVSVNSELKKGSRFSLFIPFGFEEKQLHKQ